jgi:phosphoglucose isomerase-like protein
MAPGSSAAAEAIRLRLERWDRERFVARLWERDPTLWGTDPERRRVAAQRLGWLEAPAAMRQQTPALRAFADQVRGDGFTHALLLGMGGSSLAPEVLNLTWGGRDGLPLSVLDNTSPSAVREALAVHDPARTLCIVSSKSGGTIEVVSFERICFEWVQGARGADAGRAFVAITDPGTSLARLAAERGYRHTFLNPPDIGGRYSALSYFGLVPAALLGVDLEALLDGALESGEASRDRPARDVLALQLGAWLGELALAGRDKVTLVLASRIGALGSWIEQLLAESTGKQGRGLVPVTDEEPAAIATYGRDRCFVAIGVGDDDRRGFDPGRLADLQALGEAGHPLFVWSIAGPEQLGAEFLRWEIATVAAAAVLDVNPFDEPNVAEAKLATQEALERALTPGGGAPSRPVARAGDLELYAPASLLGRERPDRGLEDPRAWFDLLLSAARPGDYLALLAFLHATPERRRMLQQLRHALRDATRLAATLGYGPRYLHSTGQLHKGGPDTGVFLHITAAEPGLPIPGERYGFDELQRAQALGDYEVLERRGRRVARIHLTGDVEAGLGQLFEALTTTRPR